jgi:hypothetical protein
MHERLQEQVVQEDERGKINVEAVSSMSIPQVVHVSCSDMRALRIFHTDTHPSLMGIGGKCKEGFSLFTMLDRCVTQLVRLVLCSCSDVSLLGTCKCTCTVHVCLS